MRSVQRFVLALTMVLFSYMSQKAEAEVDFHLTWTSISNPGIDWYVNGTWHGWWSPECWGPGELNPNTSSTDDTYGTYMYVIKNTPGGGPLTGAHFTITVNGAVVRSEDLTLPDLHSEYAIKTIKYHTPLPERQPLPQRGKAQPADQSTPDPIAYSNGEIYLSHDDLASGAAGGWGHTRSYSNNQIRTATMPAVHGQGWFVNQMPFLVPMWYQELVGETLDDETFYFWQSTNNLESVLVELDANTNKTFELVAGDPTDCMNCTYRLLGDGEDTLRVQDIGGAPYFVYGDASGHQIVFEAIDPDSYETAVASTFISSTDSAGHETDATYNLEHQLTKITRPIATGLEEDFVYTYDSATGCIATATRQQVSGGVTTTIRQADYVYYGSGSTVSPAGTLESVTIKDGSGQAIDHMYYRYYFDIYSTGATNLKYVVNERAYDVMVGAGLDPTTATDAQIATYAAHFFAYDATTQKVIEHTLQGTGEDNNGTYTYEWAGSPHPIISYRDWFLKCTEFLPDGHETKVYTNFYGELLLKAVYDPTTHSYLSKTAYSYDADGREVRMISGSAIASFDETATDLGIVLATSGGKIINTTYDDSLVPPCCASDLVSSVTETDAIGSQSIPISTQTYTSQHTTISDTDWVDDSEPAGAILSTDDSYGNQSWVWGPSSSMPEAFLGQLAHQSATASGFHEHNFTDYYNYLTPATGDTLFTYVYLDPAHPPSEIMLQFFDGSGWEHRAYWGANDIALGTDATESRCHEGALPSTGAWVRLEVPVADVGLADGYVFGISYATYDGHVIYDDSGLREGGVDSTWVDDDLPPASGVGSTNEAWNWMGGAFPTPESGTKAERIPLASGFHQQSFTGVTTPLAIVTGDTIYSYVYLDPVDPPDEIMVQFYDGTGWEHRAYWGANDIDYGEYGSAGQYSEGSLPPTGQWVALSFDPSDINLVGSTISGMAFTLFNEQAYVDHTGILLTDSVGPQSILLASQTSYRDSSPAGALTTNFYYSFSPGTVHVTSKVTALPAIATTEHGTGARATTAEYYDTYGRMEWSRDADNFLHYRAYDPRSGAVVESIDDVDTTLTAYFSDLPIDWATPTDGGLNIISSHTVDPFGRVTSTIDPVGNISYITYDDPHHQMRTYPGWQTSTSRPTGPTLVMREDRAHGYDEVLTMAATPACTAGIPTGSESITSVQSLQRSYYDAGGRVTTIDTYADLTGVTYSTSASIGTLGSSYFRKSLAYDARNNQAREVNEVGTITRRVFDGMDRPIATWIGTNDTPTSGSWSPTNNTGSSNMVDVQDMQYDINGNCTKTTTHPTGSPTDDRVTMQWFDFADRRVAWKSGVQDTESTGVGRILTVATLDYRGLPTAISEYAADNVTMTLSGGDWSVPSGTALASYQTMAYDTMGRVYSSTIYGVDPSTSAVSSTGLQSDTWFDERGHEIKRQLPGGLVTKSHWDGAGRVTQISSTDGGGDTTWSDATNETGDAVLHQELRRYDDNGNVSLVTIKDRFDSETTTGDLGDVSTAPHARVSYRAIYVDAANRPVATVNVGTNGSSSYTRPESVPSRSATTLVSSNTYNDAGWVATVTDARNICTAFAYDARGLRTSMIEAYNTSVDGGLPSGSNNRTTVTVFDGIGHPLTVTAVLPSGTPSQTTGYTYAAATSSGSCVNSHDVLTTIEYPDPSSGSASTSAAHRQQFTCNAVGQKTTSTDGNGSTHTFTYDVMGRQLADAVTTLGSGVDGSVRLLTTQYNLQGRPYLFTSYNAVSAGSVVNQIQREYNDLGQLIAEYQAPAGSVVEGIAGVHWSYNDLASSANNSRLVNLTYPNGRVLDFNYNTGIDDSINRISYLTDDAGSSAGVHLEDYSYLGLGTIVRQHHAEPDFDYTLVKQGDESTGDAGDQYTGLDRFGQIVDCRWLTTSTGVALDRFQYGYDNSGNVLYENNKLSSIFSTIYGANGVSTQFVYDPLNRMTSFARGALSASGSNTTILGAPYASPILDTVATVNHPSSSHPVSGEQSWTFDQLGNWTSVATDGTTDTRTHNAQNQVTATSDYSAIGYDSNGNVTSQTGETTNVFDAWNRGVSIRGSTFTYDALGRRVTESDSTDSQYFYYAGQQMIENAPQFGATVRHQQFVYGLDYIDHVILRDRDADNAGDTGSLGGEGSGLEERLYYTHNRQFSVTGLVSQIGTMEERTIYDPYGESQYFSASYASPTATSSYANNVSFTGRWVDPTGELYFRVRYYDPGFGRFISQDPMMYVDGMSMYQFCRGNAGLIDPIGLCADNITYIDNVVR